MSNFGFWILDFGFPPQVTCGGGAPANVGDASISFAAVGCDGLRMTEIELKNRTKVFARQVLELVDSLPDTRASRILGGQLGRSATSVGANYRAACRSRSTAEMVSKVSVVEEEADESGYWLELIAEHGLAVGPRLDGLRVEAGELTAIMVASRQTLQRKIGRFGQRAASESKIENPKSKI